MVRLIIGFGICVALLSAAPATAQFTGELGGQQLQIALNPLYPEPGEQVRVTLEDYSLGVGGSQVDWFIDDVFQPQIQNLRNIEFAAGPVGVEQSVRARVRTNAGQEFVASRTIRPLYTDIIIEPQTYAPAFYAGRPLPSFGSTVYLTALIHDQNGLIDPGTLSYSWVIEDRVLDGGATRGKFKTAVTVPHGRDILVTLTATNRQGETVARRLFTFPSVAVDLQFYEVSTLYGLSYRALTNNLPMFGSGTAIRAVPYNFDRFAVTESLSSEWRIDGQLQNLGPADPFLLTIARQGNGQSRVQFKLFNLDALIQNADRSFTVTY